MDRRRFLASAGAIILAGPAAATAAPSTCAVTLPPNWSGTVLAIEGATRAQGRQGVLYPGGPPITDETRFNILSLGKMMTGALIGQLVDAGRLRFDDPVSRHLPDASDRIGQIRIGALLNHTSGLGDYLDAANFEAIARATTARSLLPLVASAAPTPPGEISYCNCGYLVAGAVIEALTGLTFAGALQQRIFDPCTMRSASLRPRPDDALPGGAAEALRAGRLTSGNIPGGPAGGAFMTAADIARFVEALLEGRLVSPDTFQTLTSIQAERSPPAPNGMRRGWGFGYGVAGDGPTRSIGHTGGVPGASAAVRVSLASRRIAIAFSNTEHVDAAAVTRDLMQRSQICTT